MARKSTKKSKSRRKGKTTTRTRRGGSKQAKSSSQPTSSQGEGLTLDRKLDIAGVIMALVGLLTLLAMVSSSNSGLVATWISLLSGAVGWGLIVLSVGLMALGLWLILRDFERLPQLSIERGAGLFLLFLLLLSALHFFTFPEDRAAVYALAAKGRGGGYLGGFLFQSLRAALGWGGTAVALMAWLLIGLALLLDVTVPELFRWVPPLILRAQDWWDEWRSRRRAKTPSFTPFPRTEDPSAVGEGPSPQDAASHRDLSLVPAPWETDPQTWVLPPVDEILEVGDDIPVDDEYDRHRAQLIEETLASFGAPAHVVEINRGPTITQFGVEPDFIESRGRRRRVRVGKVSALADDLALALAATRIRIQAPVPGRGFIGIEVPNEQIALVALRDVIESEAFKRLKDRSLRFSLGQDVSGNALAADLSAMPHLLIAGTTGSGKSVCVNALIACFLLHNTPDDLRMIMVDPKRVELTGYNGVPHLLAPVVVELERVVGALQWVSREMDQRYHKFAKSGARNIADYNARLEAQGERKLPYLVVVIDELADLMMLAPDETERTITRLAQLARATGIHLVISTQRPSVDVVTGMIKANFPARIAFATASGVDSRVILDQPGAERLLGRGDMLFQAPDAAAPVRLQGVFVSDHEILRLVRYWRGLAGYVSPTTPTATVRGAPDAIPVGIPLKQMELWEQMKADEDLDPIFKEAVDMVRRRGRASISMLQRRLRIGYTRAARLIETMEDKGIVGPPHAGSQHREILDYGP
ncbi:MAG: DNA translocase FtsK, partial [Anaerolineales bacterium]